MKKLAVCLFWLTGTLATIFVAFVFSSYISANKYVKIYAKQTIEEFHQKNFYQAYSSLPQVLGAFTTIVVTKDARPEITRQYLAKYNSPLEPYAAKIVDISDKYGLDFRLLTAIAQQESNLCKKIPYDSFNCWGYGVHSRGTLKFDSYEESIERVGRGIKEDYIDKGLDTPELIMTKYTPLSLENGGSWAKGVREFLTEMGWEGPQVTKI